MNPFQKHDVSDFPDTFVPLGQATRKPSIVAERDKKLEAFSEHPNSKLDDEAPPPEYSAYTVDGLRAEIDFDIAASGHDTAYDRT